MFLQPLMLSIVLVILNLVMQARGNDETITIRFTDVNEVGKSVERKYLTSCEAISKSDFITTCKKFKGNIGVDAVNDPIKIGCTSHVFEVVVSSTKENCEEYLKVNARETTLSEVMEVFGMLDFMFYPVDMKEAMKERILKCVLPRLEIPIKKNEQTMTKDDCGAIVVKSDWSAMEREIIITLLPMYLKCCYLGIRVDGDVATVCRDPYNVHEKEIPENSAVKELRMLPEVFETRTKEGENTRFWMVLWIFAIQNSGMSLDLSECSITEDHIKQLGSIGNLAGLKLRNCKLTGVKEVNCKLTGAEEVPRKTLGLQVLNHIESLDISEMVLCDDFVHDLSQFTELRRLTIEKCVLNPKVDLGFIRKMVKLEELRIGGTNLSDEQLDCIFGHESIRVLDIEECTIDPMYIFGGKIGSIDTLRIFNGCHVRVEDERIRIALSDASVDGKVLNELKELSGRFLFFGDGEQRLEVTPDDGSEADKFAERLSGLGGSQMIFEGEELVIIPPKSNEVFTRFKEHIGSKKTYSGEQNEHYSDGKIFVSGDEGKRMIFLDASKADEFLKNLSEFSGGGLYFMHEEMKKMILARSGLVKLGLRRCNLESYMLESIGCKDTLLDLDLCDNILLGNNGIACVFRDCRKLRKLNISKCGMGDTGKFAEKINIEELEELYAGNNRITSTLLKQVFILKALRKLDISECQLKGGDLIGIDVMEELEELLVGNNLFDQDDFSSLFKLKKLTYLSMPRCGVNKSISIDEITGLKKLKTLDLTHNYLDQMDISKIFELVTLEDLRMRNCHLLSGNMVNIVKLKGLRRLDMWDEFNITIGIADVVAITELSGLEELCLIISNADIASYFFENTGKLGNKLQVLNIDCVVRSDSKIYGLSQLKNLVKLLLMYNHSQGLSFTYLEAFECLETLSLHIPSYLLEEENMKIITSIGTLKALELKCKKLVGEAETDLSGLTNLREFSFWAPPVYEEGASEAKLSISGLPRRVRKLGLTNVDLSVPSCKDGLKSVIDSLENLEEFNYCTRSSLTNNDKKAILCLPRMRKLELCYDGLAGGGLEGICNNRTLEELKLDGSRSNFRNKNNLLLPKCLRRLTLLNWRVDEGCIKEMGELALLEELRFDSNTKSCPSMNRILKLKNLRSINTETIRFDYDERGEFQQITGFEKMDFKKWGVYRNGKAVTRKDKDYGIAVDGIKKETKLSNWKGVVMFGNENHKLDKQAIIFLAVTSEFVPLLTRQRS